MAIQKATYEEDQQSSQTNFTIGKLNESESTQFLHIGQDFTLKQPYDI